MSLLQNLVADPSHARPLSLSRFSPICILLVTHIFHTALASEPFLEIQGWKAFSPRDELRPSFEFKPASASAMQPNLILRADNREGLEGHWTKTFPIKGGEYYR